MHIHAENLTYIPAICLQSIPIIEISTPEYRYCAYAYSHIRILLLKKKKTKR